VALIDDVKRICGRLAPKGWADLLGAHGLNLGAADLAAELARPLPGIQRKLSGFEDFASEGTRGIEPGRPQHSLLYHALASPLVLNAPDGTRLREFPTPGEIEIVEDYIFAAARRTLDDVIQLVGGPVEIVLFASEYRPASETCSRLHADLVFSRVGIARVGTAPPEYDAARRGFLPESAEDPFAIRVLPARYAAYLSVRLPGKREAFRPMRFQEGDGALRFWTPVHKLFPGDECLVGLHLNLALKVFHANDKIRRIHLLGLRETDVPTTAPFRITEGIAALASDPAMGRGLLVPVPHPRLVEEARRADGSFVTFRVPQNGRSPFAAYQPGASPNGRPMPEYVHARTEVRNGTTLVNLNDDPSSPVEFLVAQGGYDALHYVDFTGDGMVGADCPELFAAGLPSPARAAYSLVTAPDFFPTCDQRELTEWTESNEVPASIREEVWPVPPDTLCDQRLAGNLQLPAPGGNPFDAGELTMPALISLFGDVPGPRTEPPPAESLRHSWLPDDAAGVFAPGWDVTRDVFKPEGSTKAVPHMAAYGLGSPFPEDAKLCSALSAFWPAVAPDSTRTMDPPPNARLRSSTSPLTDEEIGRIGNLPWDGVPGPKVVVVGGQEFADYAAFMRTDYVRSALAGKFTMRLTARIGAGEYERRVLATALAYRALGGERNNWMLLSFRLVSVESPEVQAAQAEAQALLQEPAYFFEFYAFSDPQVSPADFRRRRIAISHRQLLYCEPRRRIVLLKSSGTNFGRVHINGT
jgi:hypothetical protein